MLLGILMLIFLISFFAGIFLMFFCFIINLFKLFFANRDINNNNIEKIIAFHNSNIINNSILVNSNSTPNQIVDNTSNNISDTNTVVSQKDYEEEEEEDDIDYSKFISGTIDTSEVPNITINDYM